MRALRIFAAVAVLVVGIVPVSVEAGWNQWARFFGEYWSDGYHAPGDPWNHPPHGWHRRHGSSHAGHVRPVYYPPVVVPQGQMVERIGVSGPVRAVHEQEAD